MRVKPPPERGCLFYVLVCLCSLLTVFCVCLIVTVVLLRNHFQHDTAVAERSSMDATVARNSMDATVADRNSIDATVADRNSIDATVADRNSIDATVADRSSINTIALDDRLQSDEAAPLVVAMPSTATPVKQEPWESQYRLPNDSIPLHYDLLLNPDLINGTFRGKVVITLNIVNSRSFLVVNTKRLDIYETKLVKLPERNSSDGEDVELMDAFEYKPNEFWIVQVNDSTGIPPGFYQLHLEFRGQLTDKIVGFYRSVYTNPDTKEKRQIATSKFQPTYARQAFPCFDEPCFKSSFKVQLVRPSHGYSALSNMDQVSEVMDSPEVGQTTVEFRTSVAMVTYLACFIVSDFERLAPITISQGFPFSVYSPPHQVAKTNYSLQLGAAVTEYYINYFGVPYPLPKLDMIAIPDFVSGAMEHWGLITFREVNLLYDANVSSTANQYRVATVIAHELAHMWFGNLVTLKWWDDLWLNEGFASYMEYKAVHHVHPDWAVMDQFLVDDLHNVLKLDAALSSHPIVQTVGHPDEITELFDTISYSKGASIIRMLEDFLGEESFRQSISRFLNKFKYGNAVTQDLWDILQETAGDINITRVMDTWTRQMGFPVVTVTRNEIGQRVLTQQRFLADPEANTTGVDSPYGYKWEIPITYVTSNSSEAKHLWFNSDASNFELNITNDVEWIKFNYHQVGYYRINYDKEDWTALSSLLITSVNALEGTDRANLLEDAFSLAEAGSLEYQIALNMTRYLKNESDYVPWKVATSKLSNMQNLLSSTAVYPKLRKYIRKLIEKVYDEVTWTAADRDSHLKKRLRVIVLRQACSVGLSQCVEEARNLFSAWIANPDIVAKPPPDLRSNIYYYGMSEVGGEEEWDRMWQLYLTELDAQEKDNFLHGLAAVSEPWLLRRYIELAKNESFVRSQDFFLVLSYMSDNPVGNHIVWEFIRSEWLYLVNRFTLNDRYLGRCIPFITRYFSSEFKLQEMKTFFEQYPDAGAGKTARNQALEKVTNNIKWLQKHTTALDQWLSEAISS